MGGVILLLVIITVVLCVVILCIKRYRKNKASSVDDQASYSATKLPNRNVSIEQNPSYDVIRVDNSTIKPGDLNGINLYYNTPLKTYSKTSEDEPNYAQPSHHLSLTETIKMDTNPSYGISMGGDLGEGVNMDINPSYRVSMKEGSATTAGNSNAKSQRSSYNVTTKQYDYAYTHVNHTKP